MKFDLMPWWGKLLIVVAVVSLLAGGYGMWESHVEQVGYERANGEWVIKEGVIAQDVQDKAAQAAKDALFTERELREKFNALTAVRLKEKDDHETDITRHVNAALAHAERLSVATARCAVPGQASGTGAAAGAGTGGETRTDLLPATSAAVLRIAGDSAGLVRDYNAVVEQYRAIADSCNAP